MPIDQCELAKMKATYEAMDDGRLIFIARNKMLDLTDEAKLALEDAIRRRVPEEFGDLPFCNNEDSPSSSSDSALDVAQGQNDWRAIFGLFRKGPLLPADVAEWQFCCFEWLLKHTGGIDAYLQRRLILPTREFFPHDGSRGHELAERIFEQAKALAGMADWPCQLECQDESSKVMVASSHLLLPASDVSPAGTFRALKDGGAVITYHPRQLKNPMSLAATFAHELAHYRTAQFPEPPPGGWKMWEPATDLAAVFLGFGVFLANSRFHFEHFRDEKKWRWQPSGWRSQSQGYISDVEVLHMHALVSKTLGAGVRETLPHLKSALHGIYKRVYKDISVPEVAKKFLNVPNATRKTTSAFDG
ncbi:hypothetical protein [Rhodanobacter sp. BL-MT-08]